ncbi:MAG: oligosaccharide flippase family protein [Anaerolineales bacterium]|nr:oligosaccharide flippase family protein [Anaerolineales bacterium]
MRRWLPDGLIILGLFLIPLALFWQVTIGGRTLIPADNLYQVEPWATYREAEGVPSVPHNALLSDLVLQNYQWKHFIRQNISDGEIPLWQSNQLAGTPFLANGQHSMLYPFSILYYVLPLASAYGWFAVSQLWLAGLWMYVFICGIGLGRPAGAIAGIILQLSSFFVVSTVHPMIQAGAVWLPLILLMVEYTIQRRSFIGGKPAMLPWVLIGAGALAMSALAGHIEITYYTLLLMAFYAGFRLLLQWRQQGRGWVLGTGAMIALMVVLGLTIGAVQFLTTIEAANNSFRASRPNSSFATVQSYALPYRHVLKFLMPDVYGNPADHAYIDVFEWERVEVKNLWSNRIPRKTDTDFGIKNYVEGGAYIGILPLILAALGLFWYRPTDPTRPPYRLIFGVMALVAASFMFGTPTYALLYYAFPGVDQLHTPFRWLWAFTLCLSVFAAFGMEALQQRPAPKRLSLAVIGAGVTLLMGLVGSRLLYEPIAPLVERLYTGLAKANDAFPDAHSFYSYEFWNALLLGLLLTASGVVLFWRGKRWQWMAGGLIVIDLFIAGYNFNPAAKTAWLNFTPPSIVWLQDQMASEGPFRIQAYDWGEKPLDANSGWRYGLQDVRGYDSLFSADYADVMGQVAPQGGLDANRIDPILYNNPAALNNPLLDQLNVRYIITDWIIRPEDGVEGYQEVYVDAGVRIYENLEALPRAYTTDATGTIQAATITQYDDTEVRVDAVLAAPALLVLADNYDAGWRAFVKPKGAADDQEREVEIEQVVANQRGVQLDAGEWTVRFKYSPRSFQLGAFTSFVAGMMAIFLALVWLWQTFVSPETDADAGKRLLKNSVAPIALNLFNRGIDFAFAFIMLRILGPKDAGVYYYAIVVFGWFDIFTNFGLNTLLTREVARDREAAGRYLFNTSLLRLTLALLGIPVLVGVLMFRNATVDPVLDTRAIAAIALLYIGLIPNSISTGLTALFYAFEKAEYPAAMTTIATLVKVSLGLGALLLGWGVVGLAGASILTNGVTFVLLTRLAWPLIRANWQPARDGQFQRTMLREAWPLMMNHLLATVFFKSDVILMEAINGVTVVGTYSTAYKWLDAINIIPAFFTMALLPIMSRQAHTNPEGLKRNTMMGIKLLVMIALPTAVFTTFLAHGLIGFLGGPEFLPEGAIALQLMIWSIPIGWMNSLTQYVLIALDRQRQITGAFIVAVSFNIITNLIFLPAYSYKAAAITTIFSELVLFIGFMILLHRLLGGINWLGQLWRLWAMGGASLAVTAMLWSTIPLGALVAGGITYGVLVWILWPFSPAESERLAALVPSRIRSRIGRLLSTSG